MKTRISLMAKENKLLDVLEENEEISQFQVDNLASQSYRIFIPSSLNFNSNTKILVCIHGISRRSKEQIELLRDGARDNNTVLIVPLFSTKHHPSYQRHKLGADKFRSDEVLNNIINDIEQRFSLRIEQFDLFGFSGGAQFAHRYAFRYPRKISKLICCAAGWYTFPDDQLAYPYGLASNNTHFIIENVERNLEYFLKIPITVAVGEHDKHLDSSLNRTKKVNLQQGFNRVERATCWTKALLEKSNSLGIIPQLRFVVLPKSGHSFTECVSYGMLPAYIF